MKIVVTGGSGFIGTNYIDFLLSLNDITILNLDIVAPRNSSHYSFWTFCDILDADHLTKILTDFQPEYIVHLAAATEADLKSICDFRVNFDGVHNQSQLRRNF